MGQLRREFAGAGKGSGEPLLEKGRCRPDAAA